MWTNKFGQEYLSKKSKKYRSENSEQKTSKKALVYKNDLNWGGGAAYC